MCKEIDVKYALKRSSPAPCLRTKHVLILSAFNVYVRSMGINTNGVLF